MFMMKKKGDAETCLSVSRNKKAKSLIEKRRRARINGCLEELKAIVVKSKSDSVTISKLEKADILEMTVHYLKEYKQQSKTDTSCSSKAYLEGYTSCANAVLSFFDKTKLTDNQSKTMSQTDALQAWMTQQMLQTEGSKICKDDNMTLEDIPNVVCHSDKKGADNVSNRPRKTNESEPNLKARTLNLKTDIPVSHSNLGMSLTQDHLTNTLCDAREEPMLSSENCESHRECRNSGLPSSSRSHIENNKSVQEYQITKPPENMNTEYQVALLLPQMYQNQSSLIPLYGVIIPNTSNVFSSVELSDKEHNFDEHKFDDVQATEYHLHQDHGDCGVQDNSNCCYSDCGATKLNENSNCSVYKPSYSVSENLDVNNNSTQANSQMSKTTVTESEFRDIQMDQEKQVQYTLVTESNMKFRCQGSDRSHVYPGSSSIWRPW